MSSPTTNSSVQKMSHKVSLKEIIIGPRTEGDTSFDVITGGNNSKDSILGKLCLIGHVKSEGDDDVNYLISLLGSLAKREYYSKEAIRIADSRSAFEKTLVKLNEVLENFFGSDKISINLGLIAISDGEIMTSKLGKFKVGLARDGDFIDVINNIDLFKKEPSESVQFSNIISGKVYKDDKIFAFIPTKSTSTREKSLRNIFLQNDQENFYNKINDISKDANNFSLCGAHINIDEVRIDDIIEDTSKKYDYNTITTASSSSKNLETAYLNTEYTELDKTKDGLEDKYDYQQKTEQKNDYNIYSEKRPASAQQDKNKNSQIIELDTSIPSMIPTAVTYSSKKPSNPPASLIRVLILIKNAMPSINIPIFRGYGKLSIILIILASLGLIYYIAIPSEEDKALDTALQKKAEISLLLNKEDIRGAKKITLEALALISAYETEEANQIKTELMAGLEQAEKRDTRAPEVFIDLSEQMTNDKGLKFDLQDSYIALLTANLTVARSTKEGLEELGSIKHNPDIWLSVGKNKILSLEDKENIRIINLGDKSEITASNKLNKKVLSPVAFGKNIYVIAEDDNQIYKIDNGLEGGFKLTRWNKETFDKNISSIAIDGSIYSLSPSESTVDVLFKGTSTSKIQLKFEVERNSFILTTEEGPNLFIVNPESKIIYIVTKDKGDLVKSYSFAGVEDIKDIKIGKDETIYILDGSNRILKL